MKPLNNHLILRNCLRGFGLRQHGRPSAPDILLTPPGQYKKSSGNSRRRRNSRTHRENRTDTNQTMDSSWALFCTTAFLWVTLGSADGGTSDPDSAMLQKPVVFIPDLLQRPVDITDIFDGGAIPEMSPRNLNPGLYEPPVERYPVLFPLGRPTPDNLPAICLNADRRPQYPPSYFPNSGFGSQRRMGEAVNKAESWFGICCNGDPTWGEDVKLCCATRAWELSIKSFCREEFSVKTSHHPCCQLRGNKRLNCFNDRAPNPNYEATQEIPMPPLKSKARFRFDPSICSRYATKQKA